MIIILFFLVTFATLIARIVLVNLVKARGLAGSFFDLSGGIFPITYLFPLKQHKEADGKMKKLIRIANLFLYLFFIFFAALLLYGIIIELPHFNKMFI